MEIVLGFVQDYYPPMWVLMAIIITGSVLAWSLLADRRQPKRAIAPGSAEEIPAIYTAHNVSVGRIYSIVEYHPEDGFYSFQQFEVLKRSMEGTFHIRVLAQSDTGMERSHSAFSGWEKSLSSTQIIRRTDLKPLP